ncbi:hypothetical protein HDU93_002782 [Gonapodya sp. JEL0774]|nr:hypothetical protein HDU93_002782 [Gonapodya sp. JEL0774]
MRLRREAGGIKTTVIDARDARQFGLWVEENFAKIKEKAKETTKTGKLLRIEQYALSKITWFRFDYHAAGQNMVSKATRAACSWILSQNPQGIVNFTLAAAMDTDKKHSHLNTHHTRGKGVVVECTIPSRLFENIIRAKPEAMFYQVHMQNGAHSQPSYTLSHSAPLTIKERQLSSLGALLSQSVSNGSHIANGVAAVFLATGQDVANVAESSAGYSYSEILPNGDYYFSLTITSLIVVTYGVKLNYERSKLDARDDDDLVSVSACRNLWHTGIDLVRAVRRGDAPAALCCHNRSSIHLWLLDALAKTAWSLGLHTGSMVGSRPRSSHAGGGVGVEGSVGSVERGSRGDVVDSESEQAPPAYPLLDIVPVPALAPSSEPAPLPEMEVAASPLPNHSTTNARLPSSTSVASSLLSLTRGRELDDTIIAAAAEGDLYTAKSKEQEAVEEGIEGWMGRHPRTPPSTPTTASHLPPALNLSHPVDLDPPEHIVLTRLSQRLHPGGAARPNQGWSGVTIHDGANVVFRKWDAARSAVGDVEIVPESWLNSNLNLNLQATQGNTHGLGSTSTNTNADQQSLGQDKGDVHFSVLISEIGPQRLIDVLRARISSADPPTSREASGTWTREDSVAAAAAAAARAAARAAGISTAPQAAMSAQDEVSDEPEPGAGGAAPRPRGPAAGRPATSSLLAALAVAVTTPSVPGASRSDDGDAALAMQLQREELTRLMGSAGFAGAVARDREERARQMKDVKVKFPHPVHVAVGLATRPFPPFLLPGRFPDSVALIADRAGNLAIRVCQSTISYEHAQAARARRKEHRRKHKTSGTAPLHRAGSSTAPVAGEERQTYQRRMSDVARRGDSRGPVSRGVDTVISMLGGRTKGGHTTWADVMIDRGWDPNVEPDMSLPAERHLAGTIFGTIVQRAMGRPRSNSEASRATSATVETGLVLSGLNEGRHSPGPRAPIARTVSWNRTSRTPLSLAAIADDGDNDTIPTTPTTPSPPINDDDSDDSLWERDDDDFDLGRETVLHPTELYGERENRHHHGHRRSSSHRTKLVPVPYNIGPGDVLGCGFKRGHGVYFTLNGMRIPLPLTTRKRIIPLPPEQETARRKFNIAFARKPSHGITHHKRESVASLRTIPEKGKGGAPAGRPSDSDEADPTLERPPVPITSRSAVSQQSLATVDTKGTTEDLDPKREVIVDEAGWLMPEWCREPFSLRGRGGLYAIVGADGPAQLLVLAPGDNEHIGAQQSGIGPEGVVRGLGMRSEDEVDMRYAQFRPGMGMDVQLPPVPPDYNVNI